MEVALDDIVDLRLILCGNIGFNLFYVSDLFS